MLCDQICVQSGTQITNVHTACRARCKSCSDFSHNSTSFCIFILIQHPTFSVYLHMLVKSTHDFESHKLINFSESFSSFHKRSYYNANRIFPQEKKTGYLSVSCLQASACLKFFPELTVICCGIRIQCFVYLTFFQCLLTREN